MRLNQRLYRRFASIINPRGRSFLRPLFRLFQTALFSLILVLMISLIFNRHSKFGEWGDFFGGVLNPLLSFITFMGLLVTIALQQIGLKESRIEQKKSEDALLEQNKNLRKQNFESTFFQMLTIHNGIVNSIDLINESGTTIRGRDCFNTFYTKFNKIYRENKSKAGIKYSEEEVLNLSYDLFWKKYQTELGHYFRYLYNMIRFVKEAGFIDGPYLRLIRAQLSDQELLLLFYNSISRNGGRFTKLVEEFAMLDNLPIIRLLEKSHLNLLKPAAFGSQVTP